MQVYERAYHHWPVCLKTSLPMLVEVTAHGSVHLLCFIASFQTLHPKLHCLACRLWHRSHGEAPGKGANVNQGEFTFGCTKMTLGCIGRPLNALEHLWMHTHATLTFECLKTTLECTSKPSPKPALASQGCELHSVMKQAWHMPLRPWILRSWGHNKVWQSINNYTLSVKVQINGQSTC